MVECPAYWPRSVSVCGFWFAPLEWEEHEGCGVPQAKAGANIKEALLDPVHTSEDHKSRRDADLVKKNQVNGEFIELKKTSYKPPMKLCRFVSESRDNRPIFVGLSSMGSMGFLEDPDALVELLGGVLEVTKSYAVLLTAGHLPLDRAVSSRCEDELCLNAEQKRDRLMQEGLCCFNGRLFCFAGSVPYAWLLPQCSVAIHHGGSGTTAACLRAGVPQIICPFLLDQFYWAERMTWLGVAPQPLMPHHLMPASDGFVDAVKVVSAAIREALGVELHRCACALHFKIEGEDGTAAAVGILRATLLV